METAGLSCLFAIYLFQMKEYDVAKKLVRVSSNLYKTIVRGDVDGDEDDDLGVSDWDPKT